MNVTSAQAPYTFITGKNLFHFDNGYWAEGGFVSELNIVADRLGGVTVICPCRQRSLTGGKRLDDRRIRVIGLKAAPHIILYPAYAVYYLIALLLLLKNAEKCFCYVPSLTGMGAIGILVCRLYRKPLVIADRGSIAQTMGSARAIRWRHWPVFLWATWWEWCAAEFGYRHYSTFMRGAERVSDFRKRNIDVSPLIGSIQSYPDFIGNERRSRYRILFVGRLEKAKGVFVLLDAFELLRKSHPDWDLHLDLVGGSGQLDAVRSILQKKQLSEATTLCGLLEYGPALFDKYDQAGIIVLPSFSEGTPNVIIEGMAAGCLPVGSCIRGITDVIEEGTDGFLCPAGDAAALKDALERAVMLPDKERLRMQNNALDKVKSIVTQNTFDRMLETIRLGQSGKDNALPFETEPVSRNGFFTFLALLWIVVVGAAWGWLFLNRIVVKVLGL